VDLGDVFVLELFELSHELHVLVHPLLMLNVIIFEVEDVFVGRILDTIDIEFAVVPVLC
jgi:hypothetical protein